MCFLQNVLMDSRVCPEQCYCFIHCSHSWHCWPSTCSSIKPCFAFFSQTLQPTLVHCENTFQQNLTYFFTAILKLKNPLCLLAKRTTIFNLRHSYPDPFHHVATWAENTLLPANCSLPTTLTLPNNLMRKSHILRVTRNQYTLI